MMTILEELNEKHKNNPRPFLRGPEGDLHFSEVVGQEFVDLSIIQAGDVVALIGDFEAVSISSLLRLIDMQVVLVPLTVDTRADHEYFFDAAHVDVVVEGKDVKRIKPAGGETHPDIQKLRDLGHPGLVLFSSGTTGRPKAILHDFSKFLIRFRTPRPALKTVNFLLFDHIGGINTLLHTLFNCGMVVIPSARTPEAILDDIIKNDVELLPTTPTFLRMMLLSGLLEKVDLSCLKIITYGTERMDQPTLDHLCEVLPHVDFRQTFGMSELGILRVKSKARDSLWMLVGGEGVETKIENGILKIKSENRMLGYLNAPSPFTDGWYDTADLVEADGDYIKVVGRKNDVINVGGIKVLPSEIERVALLDENVARAKAYGADNPITGQHIEVICEAKEGCDLNKRELRKHFRNHLQPQLCPHRIKIGSVGVSHRFKREG